MKTLVLYKSKYGATKQYAMWIAESLNADIFEESELKKIDFNIYDKFVYGGGLYAGGINGIDSIVKNFDKIRDKKIIIFTVGLADTKNQDNINSIKNSINKALPSELIEKAQFFHLRGEMDYSKLGTIHKGMMAMMKKVVSKKAQDKLTQEDREMLETYGKQVSFVSRENIDEIIDALKGDK